MIRLLYITNGIKGAAGLERVLSIKANYLADNLGYEVHIITLNNNGAKPFYNFSSKIIMHDIALAGGGINYLKSYITKIKSTVKAIKPDIISVCDDGLKGFYLPSILRKPCPIIYERHASKQLHVGAGYSLTSKIKYTMLTAAMSDGAKTFDRFVVLSQANLKEWDTKNNMVISNPLPFYPAEISTLDSKKVIAVGSHTFNKGYDRLLLSWNQLIEICPDWELHIYGKSDDAKSSEKIAQDLKLTGSVFFHPPTTTIKDEYLNSSIFVLPSRSEGFGMVLIEAMACGVPCVSYDCPNGPADIIRNNEDGFLVDNGDINNFTAKIKILIENEALRKQMGRAAKENVKRYLAEAIMAQWDNLFKTLVK